MNKSRMEKLTTLLSGTITQIGFQVDVINRVSRVILFQGDESYVVIANEMVDVEDRLEIGQLQIVDHKSDFTNELAVKLDYSLNGIELINVLMKESIVGDLVSGIVFGDSSGGEIEIVASAEVECLHINFGVMRTPSDPEYSRDQYRVVELSTGLTSAQ